MADLKAWCTKCEAQTEHTWIAGNQCTCAVIGCGNWTSVPGIKKRVEAERAQRLAEKKAAAPETKAAPAETKPADSETIEPKENTMKTKLTDEKIAEIRADYAALTTEERTAAARKEIADKHGVSMPTFMKYTKLMEQKAPKGPKPGRKGRRVKVSPAARPEGPAHQAGGFKAALQAMVVEIMDARLNELGLLKVVDLDKHVEAALARAIK